MSRFRKSDSYDKIILIPLIGRRITLDGYGVVGGWWVCRRMFRHLVSPWYPTRATHRRHLFPVNFRRYFSATHHRTWDESMLRVLIEWLWYFALVFKNGSHALQVEWTYSFNFNFHPRTFQEFSRRTRQVLLFLFAGP